MYAQQRREFSRYREGLLFSATTTLFRRGDVDDIGRSRRVARGGLIARQTERPCRRVESIERLTLDRGRCRRIRELLRGVEEDVKQILLATLATDRARCDADRGFDAVEALLNPLLRSSVRR